MTSYFVSEEAMREYTPLHAYSYNRKVLLLKITKNCIVFLQSSGFTSTFNLFHPLYNISQSLVIFS